jgi:hypothetical protein
MASDKLDRPASTDNRQKVWASRGILGECHDCGKLVTRREARQQKWPLGPGWNEIHYFCPDCFSGHGFSETGVLIGLDGEPVSETVATGRDFV